MKKNILLLALLVFSLCSYSQVTNEGKPFSWKVGIENVTPIVLPDFDLKKIQKEDEINDLRRDIPWRFGYEHSVSYGLDNAGVWKNLPNGGRIWVASFESEGAKTLNFIFDQFYLPEGGTLYFYNEDRTDLLGAYTHTQNSDEMVFGSWLVDGDHVFVEYYEPSAHIGEGYLNISQVVHGYRSASQNKNLQKALNDSGACNLDVDCPIGDDYEELKDHLKKSVALIVVGGGGFCTGTLINNTTNNGARYFLTANHCLGGSTASWAFRFNWISPSPVCASFSNSSNGTFNQTSSGATLRASNAKSDMALLEITPSFPSSWDIVWAGWDRSDVIPNFSVGIHHPSGDIMKVCRDNNSPTKITTGFNGANADMWRVGNWELGVTEPGSSGSALFDTNGRIIGQLAGGLAACVGTNDNNQFDIYGRFATSWDFGNTNATRLSNWLDPTNTGQTSLGPLPALETFAVDAAVTVSGLEDICDSNASPEIILVNNGTNVLTSASIQYAFNSDAPTTINWTGNLATGQTDVIMVPEYALQVENNTFTASVAVTGDENSSNNQTSVPFDVAETVGSSNLVLTINLDDYPDETTWVVTNSSGTNIASGGPYTTEGGLVNQNITLPDDDCYTFTIFDEFDDGICCGFGQGNYTLATDSGTVIVTGGEFTSSESTSFNNFITLSNTYFDLNTEVKLYPNPTNGVVYISNASANEIKYELFTITGKRVQQGTAGITETPLDVSHLNSGMYLVKLTDEIGGHTSTQKLIIH